MSNWQERLDHADSEAEVVAVVRDYLAPLDARHLAAIPAPCRPGPVASARDVTRHALKLAHVHNGDRRSAPELHDMATFFTKAALRIYALRDEAGELPEPRFDGPLGSQS